jgi:hypothetical protein
VNFARPDLPDAVPRTELLRVLDAGDKPALLIDLDNIVPAAKRARCLERVDVIAATPVHFACDFSMPK